MIQHIVRTKNYTHYFKETDNVLDLKFGGVEVNGQAKDITEFIQNLRLEEDWIPYGYCLRVIFRNKNSKNMTAHLYKI